MNKKSRHISREDKKKNRGDNAKTVNGEDYGSTKLLLNFDFNVTTITWEIRLWWFRRICWRILEKAVL